MKGRVVSNRTFGIALMSLRCVSVKLVYGNGRMEGYKEWVEGKVGVERGTE